MDGCVKEAEARRTSLQTEVKVVEIDHDHYAVGTRMLGL